MWKNVLLVSSIIPRLNLVKNAVILVWVAQAQPLIAHCAVTKAIYSYTVECVVMTALVALSLTQLRINALSAVLNVSLASKLVELAPLAVQQGQPLFSINQHASKVALQASVCNLAINAYCAIQVVGLAMVLKQLALLACLI